MDIPARTKVCIIGGGPSGLLLAQLLHKRGIDNVLLEKHSRDHVLSRIRAGVLEHGFAELMREAGVGERMDAEGEIHDGFHVAHDGVMDRVDALVIAAILLYLFGAVSGGADSPAAALFPAFGWR